jgi:hypothetical protein
MPAAPSALPGAGAVRYAPAPVGPRSEWLERLRAVLVPCGLLVAALALAISCERERGEAGEAHPDDGSLGARREAAARRGIDWLVAQRGEMDPDWAYALFSYLYPIAPDPALAETCRRIRDEASHQPFAALPANLRDPTLLDLPTLRPIVAELLRRKRLGAPTEEASAALGVLLREHAAEFLRDTTPAQQAALLYGLSELGIDPGWTLADSVRLIRTRWSQNDPEKLLAHAPFVFGLTHIVYNASGYFARYPDPAAFAPEGAMLRRALRHYLAAPPPKQYFFLDVQGEILVALKLLRVPEDDDQRAMSERLLQLQNPDGSWGEEFGNRRFHATVVAVQALVAYPEEFRR